MSRRGNCAPHDQTRKVRQLILQRQQRLKFGLDCLQILRRPRQVVVQNRIRDPGRRSQQRPFSDHGCQRQQTQTPAKTTGFPALIAG
jgi:hypothetical protein